MYEQFKIDRGELEKLKSKNEKMSLLIETVGDVERECIPDPFIALVNSIIFQQLAYKAAISIWNRFEKLIGDITPDSVLDAGFEALRECGLSKTKISYVKNIAEAVKKNEIDIANFHSVPDRVIIEQLTGIKGIGLWTAEMFLIFSLCRKDILSFNDLSIRRGLKWLYNMKAEPDVSQFERFRRLFSPYNTLASLYLWEITIRNYFKYESIEKVKLINNVAYFESPIGLIEIQSSKGNIISLDFVKDKIYDEKADIVLIEAKEQIAEYFDGKRKEFCLPIKTDGTDFQNKVWKRLIAIPYGQTLTYKEVAEGIENEKAARAVGNANNKNKIAILIPCHRVIGSSGSLVGYEGGLWRKKWLLRHEKKFI